MSITKAAPRPFKPNWALAPGEILGETIESLGMKQAELARRMGSTAKHVSEILHGQAVLSTDTAVKLESATGVPASFWSNAEARFREHEARKERATELGKHGGWAKRFPLKFLRAANVVPVEGNDADLVESVCSFFGVASPDAWRSQYEAAQVSFRRSATFECELEATASWLRVAELRAQQIETKPYDKKRFEQTLQRIRGLSRKKPEEYGVKLIELCAESGVAVVFLELPPGCRASGAVKWLRDDKALIVLSVRHKQDDHFWFSFFHEAGHVVAADRKLTYLDGKGGSDRDSAERAADAFAQNTLIPPGRRNEMRALRTEAQVKAFAEDIGIAPGIVVGQLQHDNLVPWSRMNNLKVGLELKES